MGLSVFMGSRVDNIAGSITDVLKQQVTKQANTGSEKFSLVQNFADMCPDSSDEIL